jgi:hypothetical protein
MNYMLNVGKYRNKSKCKIACLIDENRAIPPPLSTLGSSPFSNRAAYINSLYRVRTQTVIQTIAIDRQFGRIPGTGGRILSNF